MVDGPRTDLDANYRPYDSLQLDHGSKCIRVLDLSPGKGDDELKGTLRVVSLELSPKFEAVSYTWGKSYEGRKIAVNKDSKLDITDNLHKALLRFRSSLATRTLWVDALCINQNDIDERSIQVAFMGSIYEKASKVLVWLGEYNKASHSDSWRMRLPHKSIRFYHDGAFMSKPLNSRGKKFAAALEQALRDSYPQWVDRAWIVQEFVLSRKAVLCFGALTIDYDLFQGPSSKCPNYREIFARSGTESSYPNLLAFCYKTRSMRALRSRREEHGLSLFDGYASTSSTECQNSKDKIYSLLGLIRPEEALLIKSDYQEMWTRTFTRAAFASITAQRNMDILALVAVRGSWWRDDTLPTWVPDFTQNLPLSVQTFLKDFYSNLPVRSILNEYTLPDPGSNYRSLMIRGFELGQIISTWEPPEPDLLPYEVDERYRRLLECLRSAFEIRDKREEHSRRVWPLGSFHSFAPGILPVIETLRETKDDCFLAFRLWEEVSGFTAAPGAWHRPFWACSKAELVVRLSQDDFVDGLEAGVLMNKSRNAQSLFWEYADFVGGGKRLFVSSSGHVGVAPASVGLGDLIVFLRGARMFAALQSDTPGFKARAFRGLTWVNGAKEWLEGAEAKLPLEKFEII